MWTIGVISTTSSIKCHCVLSDNELFCQNFMNTLQVILETILPILISSIEWISIFLCVSIFFLLYNRQQCVTNTPVSKVLHFSTSPTKPSLSRPYWNCKYKYLCKLKNTFMVSRTYTKRHIIKLDKNICSCVSSENGIETLKCNEITLIKLSHFNVNQVVESDTKEHNWTGFYKH